MGPTDDSIEELFESTLDMEYDQIEALLNELDPITYDRLMDRIIGSADEHPREDLL